MKPAPPPAAAAAGRTSRGEEAYAVLKRRLLRNEIPPGSLIDDREVALELGMSRTPVREALIRLQAEGFVEIAPRRGVRVLGISHQTMREVYEIITGLEYMAVELLARRRLPESEMTPLTGAIEAMRAAIAVQDLHAWTDADERFHRGLFELCGNARLRETGLRYRDQIQRAHLIALRLRPREGLERSMAAHRTLLHLLAEGDCEAARAAHYRQRIANGEELIATLDKYGLDNL